MSVENYVCPYCGKAIEKEEILFWEKAKSLYTDNLRGDFLRRHGVNVQSGNKFDRVYYTIRRDKAGNALNVVREDENGYPTMIEDSISSSIKPEELNRNNERDSFDADDEEFDDDGYDSAYSNEQDKHDKDMHNIPKRACPHCHCELPTQFGTLPTYHVAMFGGRAAGKTAYLVNLFQQLKVQLSANNLGSVDLAVESAGYLQPMIDEYEETGTTRPTPADSGLLPILCHYRRNGDEAFIVFYDVAGEGTGDPAYMANHKGIANCETLLLMIDPNMFTSGSFFKSWTANHSNGEAQFHQGGDGDFCGEPLDSFLNQAGFLCNEYSNKIKNVICVMTKIDMLLETESMFFSSGNIELLTDVGSKHRDHIDISILKQVSNDLKVYLNKQQRIDLEEKVRNAFGPEVRINVLGVSTSTLTKRTDGEIRFEPKSAAVASKHRIIEPFLVVLMYFGLLPVKTADGRVVVFNNKQTVIKEEQKTEQKPEKKHGFFHWGKKK